jgi:hypothetical protein
VEKTIADLLAVKKEEELAPEDSGNFALNYFSASATYIYNFSLLWSRKNEPLK